MHQRRTVHDLDGLWDFAFLGDVDVATVEPGSIRFSDTMVVPGCFDAVPTWLGKRGLAAYRRRVRLETGGAYRLQFGAVHHWCRVWVNGRRVGDHAGGFTSFSFDVDHLAPGDNQIVVLVDNRLSFDLSPIHLDYFDWYHYGGITRSVSLHRLTDVFIDRVTVNTLDHATRSVDVEVHYSNPGRQASADLHIRCGDRLLCSQRESLASIGGCIRKRFELPGAALWSPDAPNLHIIDVQLGDDDLSQRFGVRTVKVCGRQIQINGEPIRLLGFNRHESHPQFGCSTPDALMLSDLQRFREAGANFLRGSHYPQDPRLLDLCDQMGICVWQEATGWQHTVEHLTDPRFLDAARQNIREMIADSVHHPSVIMWGLLNESASNDQVARSGYETLIKSVRELDPTRPVTYACNWPFEDVCRDLIDIVAINTYPGWYSASLDLIGERFDQIIAHFDSTGFGDRPLIISEVGAAAVYGCRETHGQPWTEQYQAELLSRVIDALFGGPSDRVCGLSIWQFCDCRTGRDFYTRPRGFNNKGVLDEYRRPKEAFHVVRRAFQALTKGAGR